MAAGLAVIASAAGGPREIVTPELDGLLAQAGADDQCNGVRVLSRNS